MLYGDVGGGGDPITYGSKEYRQAFKDGLIVSEQEGRLLAPMLDEVVVTADRAKPLGQDFSIQGLFNHTIKPALDLFQMPQSAVVEGAKELYNGTGDAKRILPEDLQELFYNSSQSQRTTSDLVGFGSVNEEGVRHGNNLAGSLGNFAIDVVTDPIDLIGGALAKGAYKGASKLDELGKFKSADLMEAINYNFDGNFKMPELSPAVEDIGLVNPNAIDMTGRTNVPVNDAVIKTQQAKAIKARQRMKNGLDLNKLERNMNRNLRNAEFPVETNVYAIDDDMLDISVNMNGMGPIGSFSLNKFRENPVYYERDMFYPFTDARVDGFPSETIFRGTNVAKDLSLAARNALNSVGKKLRSTADHTEEGLSAYAKAESSGYVKRIDDTVWEYDPALPNARVNTKKVSQEQKVSNLRTERDLSKDLLHEQRESNNIRAKKLKDIKDRGMQYVKDNLGVSSDRLANWMNAIAEVSVRTNTPISKLTVNDFGAMHDRDIFEGLLKQITSSEAYTKQLDGLMDIHKEYNDIPEYLTNSQISKELRSRRPNYRPYGGVVDNLRGIKVNPFIKVGKY